MNCVFISPHFPSQYHRFCQRLKEAGANALGIGDAPYESLAPNVRDALTEYYRVDRMDDYGELLRACGFFTHKYGKIDRIDSLNEHWLALEAQLRDDFNVYGIRSGDIAMIRRKSVMKEHFRAAAVPVAAGRVVTGVDDALELIATLGYPTVIKPDAGVGALDTARITSQADLERFLASQPTDREYIMEAFVDGPIYSFDGLCDQQGQPIFSTCHVFGRGIMEIVNEAKHIAYYSLRQIPPALEAAGRRCLEAFKVRERFFHIEFFRTAGDEFTALEVNMRPPGGFTTDMFNYACDIDIYRIWAELIAHGRNEVDFSRKYHCCYASRKNELAYVHRHAEILARYDKELCQIDHVPGVFASALGDIGYIFRTRDEERLAEIVHYIHAIEGREE